MHKRNFKGFFFLQLPVFLIMKINDFIPFIAPILELNIIKYNYESTIIKFNSSYIKINILFLKIYLNRSKLHVLLNKYSPSVFFKIIIIIIWLMNMVYTHLKKIKENFSITLSNFFFFQIMENNNPRPKVTYTQSFMVTCVKGKVVRSDSVIDPVKSRGRWI